VPTGARRSSGVPADEAPEWYRRALTLRRIPIIAAIVVVVIILRAGHSSPPPPLKTSCTTPAFALSTYSTASHKTLRWAVTGPAGTRFALAIGVDHFTSGADGRLTPVPDPGLDPEQMRSTPPTTVDDDCKADGTFGVVLPAGRYAVRLFTITVSHTSPARMHKVAERRLTVTSD
jgi:hypothetical protein